MNITIIILHNAPNQNNVTPTQSLQHAVTASVSIYIMYPHVSIYLLFALLRVIRVFKLL